MKDWFVQHAISSEELTEAAQAAYQVYGHSSRSFPLRDFQLVAGDALTGKLLSSGALATSGNDALFDHHLKHDFLASHYLANHRELWAKDAFDHVTFSGSSFDAIMMSLEQVTEERADSFIRSVYDWNLYGVGYALSESRHHNVSEEMRRVMVAMFGERQWDLIDPTAIKARDTLKLLRNDLDAQRFLKSKHLEEVLEYIGASWQGPLWFSNWKQLFSTDLHSAVNDMTLQLIEDEDSVIGWTASNVLRRCALTLTQQDSVRYFVREGSAVVRWRAAHTLGAFPSHENLIALTGALQDADRLVRYGGLRSCFESASQAPEDLRKATFEVLRLNSALILEHSSLKDEMRRTMLIPRAKRPSSWIDCCVGLIATWQPSESDADQERWARTAQALFSLNFSEDQVIITAEANVDTTR